MNLRITKNELKTILSGKSGTSQDAVIQAITSYLRRGQSSSRVAEEKFQNKGEETARLIEFAQKHNLFIKGISDTDFLSSGAEQKVFIKNDRHVLKLNDAIYYASWEDYFLNLLLHNYFFSDTSYEFLWFYLSDSILYAVVQQVFIKADSPTDLTHIQSFLLENGFQLKKNHDYYHPKLGIILEDLHDENVLTCNGMLYFIDTVFYIKPELFWL